MARALIAVVIVVALDAGLFAGIGQTRLTGRSPFDQLLDAYRRGNHEAAVEIFSTWTQARVRSDARLPEGVRDVASRAALALFHTEAGIRNRTYGGIADNAPNVVTLGGWGMEAVHEPHVLNAYRIVDDLLKLAKREKHPGLLSFCRSWHIVTLSYCARWSVIGCIPALIDKSEHDFGEEDPEFLLLLGSLSAPWRAGQPLITRPPVRTDPYSGQSLTGRLPPLPMPPISHPVVSPVSGQQALWAFWKALDLEPTLVEARLRLARTQFLVGDREIAEEELRRTVDEARRQNHLFAWHMGALFLGELLERDDRLSEAVAFYRQAVIAVPRAHTARVALGQSLVRSGAHEEGWAMTRAMFSDEGPDRDPVLDPYVVYFAAQYWQGASRVRAMRDMVRR